jgi:hypothetical protein
VSRFAAWIVSSMLKPVWSKQPLTVKEIYYDYR